MQGTAQKKRAPLKRSVELSNSYTEQCCYEGLAGQDSRPSLIARTKENSLIRIGKHLLWHGIHAKFHYRQQPPLAAATAC